MACDKKQALFLIYSEALVKHQQALMKLQGGRSKTAPDAYKSLKEESELSWLVLNEAERKLNAHKSEHGC